MNIPRLCSPGVVKSLLLKLEVLQFEFLKLRDFLLELRLQALLQVVVQGVDGVLVSSVGEPDKGQILEFLLSLKRGNVWSIGD